jgi:hypothetical protein
MTIEAKFDGRCKRCGGRLPQGSKIEWSRDNGATHQTMFECDEARAAMAAAPQQSDATADGKPIATFLQAAKDRGLKFPKARFLAPGGGELRLSVAGDGSRYPGAIQVKLNDEWIGRIGIDGVVSGGRLAGESAILGALTTIAADPAKAASAYGALMGRCSFCEKTLTDEGSVEVGYGPICAKKFGLPHKPKGTRQLVGLQVTNGTIGGAPHTRTDVHEVIEERPDAVRVAAGWIDRDLLTELTEVA